MPAKQQVESNTSPLEKLQNMLEQDLTLMDQHMYQRMNQRAPLISDITRRLIKSGGKRLRPMLTMASAYHYGYKGNRHIDLAACVEFIHTATLLHDDVVDESSERRGQSTANTIWGNKPPILVGDFLFTQAFELMVCDGCLNVLGVLSSAATKITEGEVLQLATQNNFSTTQQDYWTIIASKTAALFEAALHVGAIIGGGSKEDQKAFSTYGYHLGCIFQLTDDLLDYCGTTHTLGKNIGDDFYEGKVTLPVLLAYQSGREDEQKFWENCFTAHTEKTELDFARAISLIRKYSVQENIESMISDTEKKALQALDTLGESPYKYILYTLPEYCRSRGT